MRDNYIMDYEMNNELEEVLADLTVSKIKTDKNKTSVSVNEGQLTVDVFQDDNEIIIQAIIGGVSNDNIDVSIAKDMVTIKGRRQKTEKVRQSDYFHQELYWGSFSRSIILPVDIDVDKARASIKNGLLSIRLPIIKK